MHGKNKTEHLLFKVSQCFKNFFTKSIYLIFSVCYSLCRSRYASLVHIFPAISSVASGYIATGQRNLKANYIPVSPSIRLSNRAPELILPFIRYLKCDDLISHLSGIHMWNKPPQVIIVSKFEEYCNSTKQNFDVHIAAQISAMLLDAASTCAKKYGDKELLLVACNRWHSSVQTLVDLYYENIICCDGNDCDAVFEEIKQILK